MGIREVINKYIPDTIPCFSYLDEDGELKNRIYYGFIPEDELNTPSCAYLIANELIEHDLSGREYLKTHEVKFAIISDSILNLDDVKCQLMSLCGVNTLPGVQYMRYNAGADAEPDLTLQHNLVGIELSFYITMGC